MNLKAGETIENLHIKTLRLIQGKKNFGLELMQFFYPTLRAQKENAKLATWEQELE